MKQGKFITLEGIDGAGKSTQLAWIIELLQRVGLTAVVTREPGGTPLGEQLRALLLDKSITLHAETEALLMFAARREHLDKVIMPALLQGQWVISDRFTDASFAYQGGGRGLDIDKLTILEQWTQGMLQPDLTLYFDVPVELGQQRVSQAKTIDIQTPATTLIGKTGIGKAIRYDPLALCQARQNDFVEMLAACSEHQ